MIRLLILSILLLAACEKNEQAENVECLNLLANNEWLTINFKTNYTIQIPREYGGPGMVGFEGNTFAKFSGDGKIYLAYGYCSSLYCFDFGDTIENPLPNRITIKNSEGDQLVLNHVKRFCNDSDLIGIFYYSNDAISDGRLYWNDDDNFKQALKVKFDLVKLDTVLSIIKSIKRK